MEELSHLKNWKLNRDENNVAWLNLDKQNSSTNTLSKEVLEELLTILQTLEIQPLPKGLVIRSSKSTGFIAGADIQEFKKINTSEAAFDLIRQGQIVFNRLASLPFPALALIDGYCLGGGLELALACRYRIVIDDPKTKLGLPEVMLGIHPGWGGTVRLPRLIGDLKALELILSGKTVSAKVAFKMGIADALVPRRQGNNAIQQFLQKLPAPHKPTFLERLPGFKCLRPIFAYWLRKEVAKKVNRTFYPAPFAAIDHWSLYGCQNDGAFISEAKSISQLVVSDTARNLVRVFFLQEKLKNAARDLNYKPEHVHIVGAGVMGGDIAAWCALKGIKVTLQDQNPQAIAIAFKRALDLFKKLLKEPALIKASMDKLIPDILGNAIPKADLIIEAIIEKPEAKIELFTRLEKIAKPEAIFATNTSTIPLKEITPHLQRKDRLIGIHFFNPVGRMPLVEVIGMEETDPTILQKGLAFVRAIDKFPLPVKSAPGFLVNRILMPYLLESISLLESGVMSTAIDKAAVDYGMPMGPIELADTVGLDVCLYAAENLMHYFGGTVPALLRKLVEQKHLGKKTGKGFYVYKNDKPLKPKLIKSYRVPEDVVERLIFRMLNEAVACLREGIVPDADFVDAGMILGAGFPPFRGGPIHYIHEQGEPLLLQRMNLLSQRYGERFLPNKGWHEIS